ncbi:hypothetical protein BDN70DRAFT_876726 [Pholiota conissans]|uniref:Uncharacterized protein n=1 Tax=Pholiota conissans TaxID=109636 RepID=A0A9P6D266_9AGAR|nr:hypothetical protein BDN70DRAFT_876726 [Pholiota conissans]
MPTSAHTIKPKADDNHDMSDLPSLSQQSNESDEPQQGLKELEKFFAAEIEKKKVQREKKFLEVAEAHLTRNLENLARDVRNAMKAVDAIYATFLLEYAACEDRIQNKYLQLQELQANLVKMARDGQREDEEANKASQAMQISGLSKTRTACLAFEKVLEQLHLSDGEDLAMNEE